MDLFAQIPELLKQKAKFCCWRYENKDGQKPAKVPYNPVTGKKAQVNLPETFTDYESAISKVHEYNGLGFRVADGVGALDLDNCIGENGDLEPWAIDVTNTFSGCYIERSPSGKGLRIIFTVRDFIFDKEKYYINNRNCGLEVYIPGATNRFVTVTGNVFHSGDIIDMTGALQKVLDKYMRRPLLNEKNPAAKAKSYLSDETVLEKAASSHNAEKFKLLWGGDISGYGSQSEADLALACILAFWCGNDVAQMDRLFRKSGLMRPKWDRAQSGATYGQITLQKAVQDTKETYTPMGVIIDESVAESLLALQPHDNPRYGWNDIGNGYLFADFYKSTARYVPERKMWYVFNGVVWKPDVGSLKTMELCKQLADRLMMYALSISDERSRNVYIDFVRRWQSRRNRETILKDASGVYFMPMSCFDREPFIFNCLNGTLNLTTGDFYKHNPDDMLSKVSGVYYDPGARCERWERFIREVMQDDAEKARFFQKALGYALTGNTYFEILFILYGSNTRNGKGTAMETFLRIMGDYGKTARPETIGMKINNGSNNPTEDSARLAGARFVNISEPDKRLTLSTATVKTLTGNDTINARYLHENSFDFRPQFKCSSTRISCRR